MWPHRTRRPAEKVPNDQARIRGFKPSPHVYKVNKHDHAELLRPLDYVATDRRPSAQKTIRFSVLYGVRGQSALAKIKQTMTPSNPAQHLAAPAKQVIGTMAALAPNTSNQLGKEGSIELQLPFKQAAARLTHELGVRLLNHETGADPVSSAPPPQPQPELRPAVTHPVEVDGSIAILTNGADSPKGQKTEQVTIGFKPGQERGPGQTPSPATNQIEIMYGAAKGIYTVHPVAALFDLIEGQSYADLVESLKNDGQQEPCVVDAKVFLDGRNRTNGMNQLGRETRVVQFADLKTGLTAGQWIMIKNRHRRHLTDDQYLATAADYQDWCKGEADRQQAGADAAAQADHHAATDTAGDQKPEANRPQNVGASSPSEFRQKPAENPAKRKRGRPCGQRSEARALAKQTEQSRNRAEQMLTLRKQAPELAKAVKQGKLTLSQAWRRFRAEQKPINQGCSTGPARGDSDSDTLKKATNMLLKLTGHWELERRVSFWLNIIAFVSGQPGVMEPNR